MIQKGNGKKILLVLILVILCGILYVVSTSQQEQREVVTTDGFVDEQVTAMPDGLHKVWIHICGAVNKPGVYEFDTEPRAAQVIERAGGLTKKADAGSINQAETVTDGTQLVVAEKASKSKTEKEEKNGLVNINTATMEELMTLSGIGQSKASLIISHREEHGRFQKIEDIMQITGIKEGVFSRISGLITVS